MLFSRRAYRPVLGAGLALLLSLLGGAIPSAYASAVITHLPATHFITEQLLQGTEHSAHYLPPARYTMARIPNWLNSRVANEQAQQWASQADALVHLASIWPVDPLYPLLRQYNIRLVAIDGADPQHPNAIGVALRLNETGQSSPFVWLNLNNLKTMSTLIGRDLQALYPQQQALLQNNQQQLLQAIARLELANNDWLFEQDVEQVIVVGSKLDDFVFGYNLYQRGHIEPTLDQWQESHWQQLAALNPKGMTLLLERPPNEAQTKRLQAMAVTPLVIDVIDRLGSGVDLNRWALTPRQSPL
ncbi:MAG: hypothetical protein R3Y10_01755 [Ferrimonas sp.]